MLTITKMHIITGNSTSRPPKPANQSVEVLKELRANVPLIDPTEEQTALQRQLVCMCCRNTEG